MNLALIPLLIAALLFASTDSEVETVHLILSGNHQVGAHEGALIVGDASVTIFGQATVPGSIYVIGGELAVDGTIAGDVTQLAGSARIGSGAEVGGELQHVAGKLTVADEARVGRRTTLEVTGGADRGGGILPQATLMLVGGCRVAGRGWDGGGVAGLPR